MIYTNKIIKFYEQANLGPLFTNDAQINEYCYGDEASGLYIIFQTKLSGDQIIDCRYKVLGCGYTIALCVWLEDFLSEKYKKNLLPLELKNLITEFDLPQTKHKVAIAILDIYQQVLASNA